MSLILVPDLTLTGSTNLMASLHFSTDRPWLPR